MFNKELDHKAELKELLNECCKSNVAQEVIDVMYGNSTQE